MWRLYLALCLILSFPASAQQPNEIAASIQTPILELLKRADARAIVEKHLPSLVRALDEDYEAQVFFGDSNLLELSIDDNHVIGFGEEMLEQIRQELSALEH